MSSPTKYPNLEVNEAAALIAVSKGEALPDQQILAYKVITEKLCDMYGFHYYPDSQRSTDFALGKAFIGQMMVGVSKTGTEFFRKSQQQKGKQNG